MGIHEQAPPLAANSLRVPRLHSPVVRYPAVASDTDTAHMEEGDLPSYELESVTLELIDVSLNSFLF